MRIRRPRPDAAAAGDRRRERRGPAAAGRSRAGGASKRGRRRPAACGPGGPREQDARSALRRRAAAGRHGSGADRSAAGRHRRRVGRQPRFCHRPVGDGGSDRGRQRAGSSRGPGDPRSSGREARQANRGPAFVATERNQGSPRSAWGRKMTLWLAAQTIRRAPRRLVLAALGVAFPVSILAATLLFVNLASNSMTQIALAPVQLEMRALATTLDVNLSKIDRKLAAVPGVSHVDRFASANVFVGTPGGGRVTARLFAVDPSYLGHHPGARVVRGSLTRGALLDQGLGHLPGSRSAKKVSIELPGARRRLGLSLPAAGTVDLRRALSTWFGIPTGTVQGDVALVPRAIVSNYRTFRRWILPALRAELGPTTPVLDPGLTDLPPVSVESHVSIDHRSYPSDPGRAVTWTNNLRHILETQAPGRIVVSDLAVEQLTEASADAANAKVLFLLLGIPGALAGGGRVGADLGPRRPRLRRDRRRGNRPGHQPGLGGAKADSRRGLDRGPLFLLPAGPDPALARSDASRGSPAALPQRPLGAVQGRRLCGLLARRDPALDSPPSGPDRGRSGPRRPRDRLRRGGSQLRLHLSSREAGRRQGGFRLRPSPHPREPAVRAAALAIQ